MSEQAMTKAGKRPIWRSPWFWAALTGMIAIPVLRQYTRRIPEPPKKLYSLPQFQLLDHDGRPFGLEQLKGRVTVVNFFFTSCQMICLELTKRMKKLQDRYAKHNVPIYLVSISVDPDTDRPGVLKKYALKNGADLKRWTFVTTKKGRRQDIVKLVTTGFKTAMGEKKKIQGGIMDIAHSAHFTIVDRDGAIRGFYKTDKMGLDEIFHRSQHVLKQK